VERRFELHFDRINKLFLYRFNVTLTEPFPDYLTKARYKSIARWLLSSADLRAVIVRFFIRH
jgi:hypothetical protein